MYVKQMSLYNSARGTHIEEPILETILEALSGLDGDERTDVILMAEDDYPYLSISGGEEGCYLCTFSEDDETQAILVDLTVSEKEEEVLIACGNQDGYFPASYACTLDAAKKATITFAQDGTLEASLSWRRHGRPPE